MLAPGSLGMWGERAGELRAGPRQVGREAGRECEVIPGTNNRAELARPVPHPPPRHPGYSANANECQAVSTPETAPQRQLRGNLGSRSLHRRKF